MKPSRFALAFAVCAALGTSAAHGNEIPLYETGPAEDSSFLRFVNGTNTALEIKASGAKTALALNGDKPVSDFLPVRANRALKGDILQDGKSIPTDTTVAPGEFVSVVVLQDKDSGLTLRTIRETPDDFNALKASLVFYNLNPNCADASLKAAGRDVLIFRDVVADSASDRRQVNPVALGVQLVCAGQDTGEPLSLGTLQAGERYTIFLVPSGAEGSNLFYTVDSLAF